MIKCDYDKFLEIIKFIKDLYKKDIIPLHEPVFLGNEKKYLVECIDSTYVSYVGEFVSKFEKIICEYTKAKYAVAIVNGTSALHITLKALDIGYDEEVITQPLTFVATANAISHCGAYPVFLDVDLETMGMSPESLRKFLKENVKYNKIEKTLINKYTNRKIKAIIPVHIFGHPCRIDEIVEIAQHFELPVIEDSAEALGSFYKGKHCGTFGDAGILSFNGNKTLTTGGGGMVITNNDTLANKIRHLTTTAKVAHPWEYIHDEIGYNYRMPNINASLGVAQMEYFDKILSNKRKTAMLYKNFFKKIDIRFFTEPIDSRSNYWLNSVILENIEVRDKFLEITNENGVMTRPIWRLIHKLDMYKKCYSFNLKNSGWLQDRVVNIPSGYRRVDE